MESPAPLHTYSLVIVTFERPEDLEITLASVVAQTRLPLEVVIVDSSQDDRTSELVARWKAPFPLHYLRSTSRSAAKQRNEGWEFFDPNTNTIIGFMDDDITLRPDTCEKLVAVFDADPAQKIGGVAARIEDFPRAQPQGWLWWYYRIQAGYSHPTYGGHVFGPAINCLPCYTEAEGDLIPAGWLNSGCVFYRDWLFSLERFPDFDGYSFMEDVHLAGRVARTHRLFFHKNAWCVHRNGSNSLKGDVKGIARQRMSNQKLVAQEVLGHWGPIFMLKMLLHRIFVSIAIVRRGDPSWRDELLGTWT